MLIFFFWVLFAIAVGIWATNKGRNGFGWFCLSLVISPLLGGIFCAVAKNISADAGPSPATHVRCPACAEFVLPEATVCKHCGKGLTPQSDYVANLAREREDTKSKADLIFVGILVVLGVGVWWALGGR